MKYELRANAQYGMTIFFVVLAVVILVAQVVGDGWHFAALTALFGVGMVVEAYALFMMPSIRIDAAAITLRNTYRDVRIPFSQLRVVEARYGLTLTAANGRSYHPRFFGGTTARSPYRKHQPEPIPVISDGEISTTARTREVEVLIGKLMDGAGRQSAGQKVSWRVAWDRVSVSVAGFVVMAVAIMALTA
ncbi:PH domain-containing protein [Neoactinobaculum massilliense]|uniref:PH domain-containing protein n=1 Tax=Neoactinobaculum massilliense TaxID=2364794 RepID=UPI000F51FD12|nr:PH domain-containing protein [Neoactinobaculum massilliense]